MIGRLSDAHISATFQRALKKKGRLIEEDDTSVIFYNLTAIQNRIDNNLALFPRNTFHTIAVKANPLLKILGAIRNLGVGLEVASFPELQIAVRTGFPAEKIVFDSPAKTMSELQLALNMGVHLNADSLSELDRIDKIIGNRPRKSTVGIRINPQVGAGRILSTSVAGEYSKFGVPIGESRAELLESFFKYDWLNGVHLHIGSQGCSVDQLLQGVKVVFDFAEEVNIALKSRAIRRRIWIFDLGGGLPVTYRREDPGPSMARYCKELRGTFPKLFTKEIKLITEFGRYIYANSGWVASRVEYVKESATATTATIHVGADLFLRECYNPQDWQHEILVLDSKGRIKSGSSRTKYVIAGPLCFSGDILARGIKLPKIEVGDYIIIKDAGAYTLSMWSRYNSRQVPKVIGYSHAPTQFELLKKKEDIEQIMQFWS